MHQLRHLLVGVKPGSPNSHPLSVAMGLAARAQARVTALSVADPATPPPAAPLDLPDCVVWRSAVGIPAIEIAREAELGGADLVVLGRQLPAERPPRDGRDTVEGTVRRARVPCLLVPPREPRLRRVMAAADRGPDTDRVIAAARLVARLLGAAIYLIRVEEPVGAAMGATGWSPAAPPSANDWTAEGDTIQCQGDPVAEILRVVRADAVDLLVFGHHRGGPISAHATSGVAARLLQRAPCAVMTVPV